jgi:hypothetical protein
MSLKPVSVDELRAIASEISLSKKNALISKYYNDIMIAAHEGKFRITFILESDDYGEIVLEAWDATEEVEKLFPGIQTSYDRKQCTYTFEWYNYTGSGCSRFIRHQAAAEKKVAFRR